MRKNKNPIEEGNYLSQESQEIWQKAIEKLKDELLLKMQTKQFQLLLGRKERKKMPTKAPVNFFMVGNCNFISRLNPLFVKQNKLSLHSLFYIYIWDKIWYIRYMIYKLKYGDMVVIEYLILHLNIFCNYCYKY